MCLLQQEPKSALEPSKRLCQVQQFVHAPATTIHVLCPSVQNQEVYVQSTSLRHPYSLQPSEYIILLVPRRESDFAISVRKPWTESMGAIRRALRRNFLQQPDHRLLSTDHELLWIYRTPSVRQPNRDFTIAPLVKVQPTRQAKLCT